MSALAEVGKENMGSISKIKMNKVAMFFVYLNWALVSAFLIWISFLGKGGQPNFLVHIWLGPSALLVIFPGFFFVRRMGRRLKAGDFEDVST